MSLRLRLSDAMSDSLFLSLVVLLSMLPYVRDLGFYSDDWDVFGKFSVQPDQSVAGYFRTHATRENVPRPVESVSLAVQYWLFGAEPLGYHLVNSATFLSHVPLFYLVLRELGQPRLLSLAIPAVYGLLPQYSTERFWISTFMANLSITLYLLSFYADLRGLRARSGRFWAWKGLGILSLLGSTLAYEVALPLFLLNAVAIWHRGRTFSAGVRGGAPLRGSLVVLLATYLLVLTPVVVFKFLTSTRLGIETTPAEHIASLARRALDLNYGTYDYGFNVKQALAVNYGIYGLGLPRLVWRILRDHPQAAVLGLAGATGVLTFCYLYRAGCRSPAMPFCLRGMLRLIGVGLLVFGLGYVIFLTTRDVQFTPAGVGNRTAIAAAIGVAMSLVGGLGLVTALLPWAHLRRACFCALIALLCASGLLVNNTLASFWVAAYRQQQAILSDIGQRFPSLPPGTTLILDGVCPYVGPAVVFDSSWDLEGALRLLFYRDPSVKANVVTPRVKVAQNGLDIPTYGVNYHYGYGQMLVYDYRRKTTYQLNNVDVARHYFTVVKRDLSNGCPPGHEGHGVPVF